MTALADLVAQLMADGELDADDLARIAAATARERVAIGVEKSWRETAHVHETPHVSVITTDDDGAEHVDASGVVCHDCGRDLVSDVGSIRLLVCPQLHGRRPHELVPPTDGAVECGRPPRG